MKRNRLLVAALGLGLAIAGTVWRYGPRVRDASAVESAELRRVAGFPSIVWVAFPHQNLAVWERSVGDFSDWIEAGIRASGQSREYRRVAGFGPFVSPPAREMVLGFDPVGQAFEVRVSVYAEVRWLARLAGALASNPWLSGGSVDPSRGGSVSWERGVWVYRRGAPTTAAGAAPDPIWPPGSGVAAVRLSVGGGFSPPGALCLVENGTFRCGPGWDLPEGPGGIWQAEVDPFAAPSAVTDSAVDPGGWFLLPEGGAMLPLGVVRRDSARHPALPVEKLLDATGALAEVRDSGWVALVAGSGSEPAARDLLALVRHLELVNRHSGERVAWLRPSGYATLERARGAIEEIPFVAPREIDRWRDLEDFLRPFAENGFAVGIRWNREEGVCLLVAPSSEEGSVRR